MAKNPFSNTTSKKNKDTDDSVFQAVTQKAYRRAVESRRDPSPASSPIYQSKVEMPTTQTVAPAGNSAAVTPPTTDAATRKNQIEARLKQIDSEYSTTATVLSGYQRGGLQKSNAYLTAKERADSLKMEKQELEKELQTVYKQMAAGEGYREANFIDNTWNSFNRGRYNSLLGKESYDALWETDNEKKKYEDILAGDDYMFVPSNKFEQAVSGVMEQLGQQYVQATDPRSVAMAGTAGTAAFIAGQAGPQVLVPEEVITVPSAMIAGWQVGSSMSNFEIEAGLAYNEMLENGVSEDTARKVALAVGGVNAALELAQLDELTKCFKILNSNPATVGAADTLRKRLIDVGIDVTKSVGKETAQEVLQEATTIHGVQQASRIDTGEKPYTTKENLERLGDTALSSALTFGLMNVPHAAVGTHNAVRADRIGNQYIDNVDALIEEGMQSDQNSDSYKIASRLKARLDNGEKVSNTEAYDLAVANQRSIAVEPKLAAANADPVVESSVETPAPTRVQTIQSRLTEVGMEATEAEGVAQTIDRILNGDTTVTSKDKDVLRVGNSAARQVFEEESGVKLPASNSSTRKAVSEYIAQAALKQQKQESTATVAENETVVNQPPVNVMSTEAINQLKGSVSMPTATVNSAEVALRQAAQAVAEGNAKVNAAKVETTVATVGAKGQVVYQKHLPNAKNVAAYTRAFERYYDAGQIGYPLERMTSEYAEGVDPKALVEAYNAGAEDASLPSEGKPTTKNKNAQKGVKTPSKSKGRFYDNRTIEGKAVAEKDVVALKQFAKVFNIDIELVDSIDVGDVKSAANGYYSRSERKIYLAADSDNPLMTVLKHEVTHHIQRVSPKQYKALKDYVMKAYYNNSQEAMNAEIQIRIADAAAKKVHLTRSAAMDEIVADATEVFLTDRDSIDALVRENRSLAETILNAIRDVLHKIEAAMRGVKVEGKHSFFMDVDQIKTAEKMWVEALADAANSEIGVNDVVISESSVPVWSLKSMKFDLLDGQMQRDLVEHGILTLEESQHLMDEISKLIDKMSPFAHIVDMNEEYSKDNRPFAVYKPNSDPLYKVSLDFSTLCKKRLMTQFVIESLQTKLGKAMSAKEQIAIRSKLEEYGKVNEQIQVACALCYVEARRLKAPDQINRFLDDRTTILTDYFGKKNKDYKKKVDDMADQMKVEMGYKADTKLKDMKPSDKKKVNEAKQKMMKEYIPSAEEQKIIDRANTIDNAEFLNQAGLTRLNLNEPVIYDAFVSHVRNATKSKALEGGVPYYYGDSKSVSDSLIEAMNAENGLRHQSWSDFEIVHLLDTIAAVIDLSVRKAKMQSYTKVPAFVHVNGNTGMMINLSLIPAGKNGIKDGKLDFSPTEGMDYAVAVDLRDQYHKTTGTIAIGIDDKQIEMLLDDPTIDYVIPYHTSGMNAQLRKMAGISGWVDYESFQSEKEIKGAKQGDCPDELWHKKPDFSEWFDTSKLDMSKSGVEIMREAAGRYLVMCEERGLHPKFSNTKQHTDFSKHENYWKLLIDRKMVDGDGNIIIQQAVRPNFDFDKISEVVDMEIKNYDPTLLDSINEKIMKEWESGGIKQREAELLKDEKTKKKAAKVANGLVEQVVQPTKAKKITTNDGDGQFSLKINHRDGSVEEIADARNLTAEQAIGYLRQAKSGALQDDAYIPVRRDTPQTIIETARQVEDVDDLSLIMQVVKAKQSMKATSANKSAKRHGNNTRPHSLTPEQIVEILDKMDDPVAMFYQTNRKGKNGEDKPNNFAVLVEYKGDGTEGLVVVEFNPKIDPKNIGEAFGEQRFHTVVTVFEPDTVRDGLEFDIYDSLQSSPDNIELEIKRRHPDGSAYGKPLPSTSDRLSSKDSVLHPDPSVNDFSFKDSIEMEADLDALRQERTDLEEQIDDAYFDELPDTEIRKLNNRLTKVNADIDKIVAEERKAAVLTPMQTILDNLSNYRRSDLESLAEQISRGAWDDYEEMSRAELEEALRETINDRELSPLEMQSKQFGLRVRPVVGTDGKQFSFKDSDYMAAVERGDMETAQKMVDEAAKAAGYTVEGYHGTSNGRFNSFKHGSSGIYMTSDEEVAKTYGNNVMRLYGTENNQLVVDAGGRHFTNIPVPEWLAEEIDSFPLLKGKRNTDTVAIVAKRLGYSSLKIANVNDSFSAASATQRVADDYVYFESLDKLRFKNSQVKSADPVTYDDNGNVIPLSERFNTKNDAFRYQLKTPDEMLDISKQIAAEEHKAKAVTDAEIMSQAIKDMKLNESERIVVKNYQDAMKKLADYEKDLAVYEATKGEHSKGRSIYTDASGKVKKSGLKYSAEERAEIQRKVEWWKRRLREIEQKEEFKKVLAREKAKMTERHAKEIAKLRAGYDARLADLREKRDAKVEAEKQRLRDYKQFQRDSKEYKALKAKLESDVKWLNERLVHPTDAKHIPEEFKKGVAAFLNSLDFESKYTDSYEVRNGKPSQKVINLRELNKVYDEILKDQSSMMELDETMLEALKELEKICENKRVADLDYAELGLVRDAIEYIKMSVAVANKAFNADIKKTISEMGEALIQELRSMKSKKDRTGIVGEADKLLNYDNVAPSDKFHELGGVMEMLYKEIRKGFDKHINNVQTAIDYTQKLTSGHEEAIKAWSGDKAKTTKFQISDGTTIELTPAQVMSLYCLMKREQALGHVLGSGIVPSGVVVKESKKYGKVKLNVAKKVSAERASRCTIEDIQKIVGTLTDDQKRVADGVAKLFTTKCADWGNETSMRLYGYKKFNEKNYFPIKSSDAYLNARFDDSGDVLIKNLGFTKNTVVKANNPIVVEDIFDVLADHVNKMSMYNALVVPLTDFTRVFNYKSKNTDNTIYDSVQKALETAGGRLGVQYIKQFMKDVNRQAASLVEESLGNKALSNYKKAKIGANLRVLAQQPTAIVRAAAMVDPKYLIKGLQQKANYEEMFNNSEIAYWKSLGFYQTDMGRNMKDILLDNESKLDQLTMSMYGKADDFAWVHLWNAIKLEVADTHPNVDKTSSEFMDLVKVRFDEVVDRTQVVDSVFHRSQLMRSGSLFTKMVTAFMAEPTKSYNLLRSDLNDSIRTKDYSKFKRSAVTFVANAILVSAFAGFVDMIRDDDDEDEEGNKRTLADKYLDATVSNIADNVIPLNLIPYIKDIVSIGKGYDVNRMDMAAVTQFMTVARKWTTGKYSAPYLLKETVGALADLVGIPLKNAVRDVAALTRTAGDIVGGHHYADYFVDKMKYNIANPDNRSVFYKHYTDALLDGDEKAAEMILADMVVNGIPYDNIIAKGYQKEKEITFSEARKLIADGKDDDARKLVRELANKYDKKYTTLWKAVRNGDSAGEPEETYDFNDFKKAVKKGEDTELIEDYLTEYGGYSEEDLEEAIKLLTGGK